MNIQVIGAGIVGRATDESFSRFDHNIVFCDIDTEKILELQRLDFDVYDKPVSSADIHFICTPEGIVENIVDQLTRIDGLIVIRSSVLPGTTKRLAEK